MTSNRIEQLFGGIFQWLSHSDGANPFLWELPGMAMGIQNWPVNTSNVIHPQEPSEAVDQQDYPSVSLTFISNDGAFVG